MTPRWPMGDPTVFIDHWEYRPAGGGLMYPVEPDDIIHFRAIDLDPRNSRLGISELKAAAARSI